MRSTYISANFYVHACCMYRPADGGACLGTGLPFKVSELSDSDDDMIFTQACESQPTGASQFFDYDTNDTLVSPLPERYVLILTSIYSIYTLEHMCIYIQHTIYSTPIGLQHMIGLHIYEYGNIRYMQYSFFIGTQ